MADLSFSFNPSDISAASDAASDALSKIAGISDAASDAKSQASDALSKVSNALSKATAGSAAASNALSKATAGSAAASDALSQITVLDGTVIKSLPGAQSYAVHEIMITSASLIKYVWSSVAAV